MSKRGGRVFESPENGAKHRVEYTKNGASVSRPRRAGGLIPPRRNLDTILYRHRLICWAARILEGIRDNYGPAVAACEPSVAHGSAVPRWASRPAVGLRPAVEQTLNQPHATGLPTSGSPQESVPSPAYAQRAVWRQIWGLHNKERARERNPLTSASSSRRSQLPRGCVPP